MTLSMEFVATQMEEQDCQSPIPAWPPRFTARSWHMIKTALTLKMFGSQAKQDYLDVQTPFRSLFPNLLKLVGSELILFSSYVPFISCLSDQARIPTMPPPRLSPP